MHVGLAISFLIHGALLAFAVFSMSNARPLRPEEPTPVEVAVITNDELVRLTKGDRSAKQLDATPAPPAPESKAVKEPPKPAVAPPPPPPPPPSAVEAKVEPPPPPPPPAKEPPPPEPKSDPIADKLAMLPPDPAPGPDPAEVQRKEEEARKAEQKRQDEAKQKAEAERKKRLEEQKKRQEAARKAAEAKKKAEDAKKKSFDELMADAIKPALKDNDPRKKPPPPGGSETAMVSPKRGPAAGAPEGRDTQLTASQRSMIAVLMKQAVTKCWNINSGLDGIDKMVVEVEVKLNPDGRLAQAPKVVNRMASPLFADASNSALRAIEQCQPYELPAEFYETGWRHMIVDFSPPRNF